MPIAIGIVVLLLSSGLSIVRYGALPKWLGWVAIVLAVVGIDTDRIRRLPARRDLGDRGQHPAGGPRSQRGSTSQCGGAAGLRSVDIQPGLEDRGRWTWPTDPGGLTHAGADPFGPGCRGAGARLRRLAPAARRRRLRRRPTRLERDPRPPPCADRALRHAGRRGRGCELRPRRRPRRSRCAAAGTPRLATHLRRRGS